MTKIIILFLGVVLAPFGMLMLALIPSFFRITSENSYFYFVYYLCLAAVFFGLYSICFLIYAMSNSIYVNNLAFDREYYLIGKMEYAGEIFALLKETIDGIPVLAIIPKKKFPSDKIIKDNSLIIMGSLFFE
ncbi:hypothetical protein KAK05_00460 [Candidatus Parcubacteria bacterium]|nr:hypothetical protein [Candidatus Parcubacteria bacterium]